MSPDDATPSAPASGRRDYDQLAHFKQLAPGERWFLIRARDSVSGDAVRAYAALLHRAGGPPAAVESALQQADAFDAWPDKKLPDADHLGPEEAKELEYELGRRAWDAREDCADIRVMLAEERATTAAFGRLRPLLQQLLDRLEPQENGDLILRRERVSEGNRKVADLTCVEALRRFLLAAGRWLPHPAEPEALMKLAGRIHAEAMAEAFVPSIGMRELTWDELVQHGFHHRYLKAAALYATELWDLRQALVGAYYALRSYQHGNASLELAAAVADHASTVLARTGEAPHG